MKLLKQNKGTELIADRQSGEVMVASVKKGQLKDGTEVVHVTILNEGVTSTVTVGAKKHSELKVGPAMLVQTEWSKKSKFGANVGTEITNF